MNVFDFAIDLERSSSEFYRRMAGRTDHPGLKNIFGELAQDDENLLNKFRDLKEASQGMASNSRILASYLGEAKRLFDPEAVEGISTDLDAYGYAVRVEDELCRVYENAVARESDPEVKGLLMQVAQEERGERESIRNLYDFVNAPNEYLAWGEFSNIGEFHNFGRDEG